MTLYAGSSGYSYESWKDGFYTADARPADFLASYAARLPSVELNTTGYRLPAESVFAAWAQQTPPHFRFSVKTPRAITHTGRLDRLGTFLERVRALGDRLGPLLVQVPEERPRDDGFLERLLGSLDPGLRVAFELRHESWTGVEPRLDEAGAARVGSLEGAAPFRYLRLREPPYTDEDLAGWAARLRPLLAEGVDVYCYFKHEDEPTAPAYAQRLLALAGDAP